MALDDPRLWISRIKSFQKSHWEDVKAERLPYREALELKFDGRWSGSRKNVHAVNYSFRYITWFQAQVTGDPMVMRSSRDADGDEETGEMVDILLGRVVKEGGAYAHLRNIIPDLGWFGCGAIWYGFHAQHVTRQMARDAGRSASEIADRAEQGDVAPRPDEDHQTAADVLDARAAQEQDSYTTAALGMAATMHDQARLAKDGEIQDIEVTDHRIWFRRGRVGIDTFWSNEVIDHDDIWWMAHKVCYLPEIARKLPSLKRSLASKLKGTPLIADEQKRSWGTVFTEDVPGSAEENLRVELYYVWDKRTRKRHIISPEMPDKYLERDDSNPYVDAEMNQAIPGFFPCQLFTAIIPPSDSPLRTLGLPMIAPGWSQQMEANELRTLTLANARRHSVRHYVLHPMVKGPAREEIMAKLSAGEDGQVFDAPPSFEGQEIKNLIVPLQFSGDKNELVLQSRMVEADWVKVQGMPIAELTSQATAGTATQEQIGISAGHNQAEDIIKQLEDQAARMMEGVRGLVRAFYPDERIAALVGPKYAMPSEGPNGELIPSLLDKWNRSSLEGDDIRVRFGVRAKAENAVRTNQLMQAIETVRSVVEPTTGLPRIEEIQLVEELTRSLGVGKPREVDPTLSYLRNLVVQMASQLKQMSEQAAASSSPSQKPGKDRKPGRSKKAPTQGNLESGARKGTSSASA